jgi:hypothetical protein
MEGTHLNGILNFIHGRYHHNYVVLKQSCFYYTGSFESFNSFEIHLNSENVSYLNRKINYKLMKL